MSDSIDRVFAHALQTVRKIPRTGSARPPTEDRLRLYGLYKQSMEGDVSAVMERPAAADGELPREQRNEIDKWDAWHACAGLSRGAAKRRYIDTLLDTMHVYASGTAEARELVAELEFVWDQVKRNTDSGSGMSSGNNDDGEGKSPTQETGSKRQQQQQQQRLRILRPMSSQSRSHDVETSPSLTPPLLDDVSAAAAAARTAQWQARMESALVQTNAEIAALREVVLESRRPLRGASYYYDPDGFRGFRGAGGRSGGRGDSGAPPWWQLWKWRVRWLLAVLWRLARRTAVDAAVLGAVALALAWWRVGPEGLRRTLLGAVDRAVRGESVGELAAELVRKGVSAGARVGAGATPGAAGRRLVLAPRGRREGAG